MSTDRHERTTIIWRGITIEIGYEADWLGLNAKYGHANAHLEIRAKHPERALLPVTDTGYRSYFHEPGTVEVLGGPEAFVIHWLDQEAKKTAWKKQEVTGQQLSLF